MRKHIFGSGRFIVRKLEEARDAGEEAIAIRQFDTEIKAVDGEARAFDFTISTSAVDRYGDTVAADGWKLTNFRKNPVVLWMHNNAMLPIARATNIRIEDGKLKSRAIFEPEGLIAFNDHVARMLSSGFLSATSVGFIPLKYNFVDDPQRRFGIDFLEQELLEFSVVTVPANAEALIEGRAAEPAPAAVDACDAKPEGRSMELVFDRERLKLLRLRAAA